TVAVATVVMDRTIGLFALVLLAGIASLLSWPELRDAPALRQLALWVIGLVAVGAVGFALLFAPMTYRGGWAKGLERLPVIGGSIREVLAAIGVYSGNLRVIFGAVLLGIIGHVGFVSSLYLVAASLPGPLWPARVQFVVAPLGLVINAIPLAPGGLGVG